MWQGGGGGGGGVVGGRWPLVAGGYRWLVVRLRGRGPSATLSLLLHPHGDQAAPDVQGRAAQGVDVWMKNLCFVKVKVTLHATAAEIRKREERDGPRYAGYR